MGRIMILLLINRPHNPKTFIIEKLQNEKDLSSKALLNDDEIETMFKMLECPLVEKNIVTGKKVNESLMAMGIIETVNQEQKFNLEQFKAAITAILKQY